MEKSQEKPRYTERGTIFVTGQHVYKNEMKYQRFTLPLPIM